MTPIRDFDILAYGGWVADGAMVVIPDAGGVRRLVPVCMVEDSDDERFAVTFGRGSWPELDGYIKDNPRFRVIGRLERRWIKSGPRRV